MDRAALDAALQVGIEHGGWCPRGRLAEDGPIPARYRLRQTRSAEYRQRTERNVLDSSGTLILHRGPLRGGTLLTRRLALLHARPHLLVDLGQQPDAAVVGAWVERHGVEVLNVAGPRESSAPGIYDQARLFLERCLSELLVR